MIDFELLMIREGLADTRTTMLAALEPEVHRTIMTDGELERLRQIMIDIGLGRRPWGEVPAEFQQLIAGCACIGLMDCLLAAPAYQPRQQ